MKVAVIGAGMMGRAAAYDLSLNDDIEQVGVYDIDPALARSVAEKYGGERTISAGLNAADVDAATEVLKDYDAAVSCVTYALNTGLTRAAIAARCHFIDLGGNNDTVKAQMDMNDDAEKADVVVIPDCGLAPGMVSILVEDGMGRFDRVHSVKIRVGGLPQSPRPPLNYQIVFSPEGLINEYWEPCVVLQDGQKHTVNPMTGLELLEFDGIGKLEAFYTSGGTSTLPDTYGGKIDFLDYKTIRYPGHCEKVKPMLELGLASRKPVAIGDVEVEPRAVLKAVLEKNLNHGGLDMVLVRVTMEGEREGLEKTVTYEIVDRQQSRDGLSAMMRTTAFPAAIISWMAASGRIIVRGCRPQEIAVDPRIFIPELRKRQINLTVTERTS